MRKLTINGNTYNLPSGWNELNRLQLLRIAELSMHSIPVNELTFKIILQALSIKILHKSHKKIGGNECFFVRVQNKTFLMAALDLSYIAESFNWLFTEIETKDSKKEKIIDSKLTKQLLPYIVIDKNRYYGTHNGLTNLTFNEYIFAETNYSRFAEKKDALYLDRLCAVLYRKRRIQLLITKDLLGDPRKRFNDNLINQNSKKFKQLNLIEKTAILYFYEGCRKYIANKFYHVFSYSGGSKTDPFDSFMDLTDALTKSDPTKKDELRNAKLYDVLFSMNNLAKQNKEHEKKMRKLKNKK